MLVVTPFGYSDVVVIPDNDVLQSKGNHGASKKHIVSRSIHVQVTPEIDGFDVNPKTISLNLSKGGNSGGVLSEMFDGDIFMIHHILNR